MLSDATRLRLAALLRVAVLRTGPLYARTRAAENLARHLLRRPHEADFAFFASMAGDPGLFLDVGANAGMSAVSFRIFNARAPILSLEPNPVHERDLRFTSRLVQPFAHRMIAAGAARGEAILHVPTYRGVEITPLATFDRAAVEGEHRLRVLFGSAIGAGDLDVVERRVPVRPVDDLGLRPGVVKVDVEGAEADVLAGMQATLAAHRPVLMLEWSRDWSRVDERLAGHDYVVCAFDPATRRLRRFDGENKRLNLLCLPAEHRLAPPRRP